MKKTVTIGGINVVWESSGDIPRMYRNIFGKDLFVQMSVFEQRASKGKNVSLDAGDIEMFENLAWCFAKHADPDTPDIDTWLRQFPSLAILNAAPEIIDMWAGENLSTSTLKKRNGPSTDK